MVIISNAGKLGEYKFQAINCILKKNKKNKNK